MTRPTKMGYYLNIAKEVSTRSTCLRRRYGAVIVHNDEIIATGYNGSPRGELNCTQMQECYRDTNNIPSGANYEKCRSVHAEANAIISAARKDMIGATLYLAGFDAKTNDELQEVLPCLMCARLIANSGIDYIVSKVNGTPTTTDVRDLTLF